MYETLKEILIVNLRLDKANISPEADFDEAGLDSLAVVELGMVLSKRLGIEIDDYELAHAGTVGQIVSLMEERVART